MQHRFLLLFAALAGAALLPAQVSVTGLTYLGDTGSEESFASGINVAGNVSGFSRNGSESVALYYSGSWSSLPGLEEATDSRAFGINNAGQVAGFFRDGSGNERAFILGDTLSVLGTLSGGDTRGYAINAAGHVAGFSGTEAFLYNGSTMLGLGFLPGASYSSASAINSSDQVAGDSGGHVFFYSGGVMTDLGTLSGGSMAWAAAINASGQVVGYSESSEGTRAFLSNGGSLINLGTLGGDHSEAYGINDAGHIVGSSREVEDGDSRAFFYVDGTMYNLNTLAATFLVDGSGEAGFLSLNEASAVNEFGQIVGTGSYFDGSDIYTRAYMLNVEVSAIPEPSTYAALFGAVVLGLAARRRRFAA